MRNSRSRLRLIDEEVVLLKLGSSFVALYIEQVTLVLEILNLSLLFESVISKSKCSVFFTDDQILDRKSVV